MPRQPRIVLEGMPHHVTQRGNYRQKIFDSKEDFQRYSCWMSAYSLKYNVEILAYCLMTNHVHFILEPKTKNGLAMLFNITHMRYSQYKNKQAGKKGHLRQGRFFSSALDADHLLRAIRYVERNPVRAGMVEEPEGYIWSSTRFHLGIEKYPIIKTVGIDKIKRLLGFENDWFSYLQEKDDKMVDLIRAKTKRGKVIASEENISSIEQKFGIILRPKKVGRYKKL